MTASPASVIGWALTAALVTAPLTTALPAGANAASCRGESATIVGSKGTAVTGTPGRDVIVTNGSFDVDAGDGDDLICVTVGGPAPYADEGAIAGGPGNDVIDTTALSAARPNAGQTSRNWAFVDLGAGSDTFVGGPGADTVLAGNAPGDADTVSTGDGDDEVTVGDDVSVAAWASNDTIDLGAGRDNLRFGASGMGPTGSLEGGLGDDTFDVPKHSAYDIDLPAGTARLGDHPAVRLGGFDSVIVGEGPLRFVGTDAPERLWSMGATSSAQIDMGGGDDHVALIGLPTAPGSFIRGGTGPDTLAVNTDGQRLRVDLAGSSMTQAGKGSVSAADFTSHHVVAKHVRLLGSAGDDHVTISSCTAVALGRRGDDTLIAAGDHTFEYRTCASKHQRHVLRGGPGNDTLRGHNGRDLLLGGTGRDWANGSGGKDRCVAERTRSCERR